MKGFATAVVLLLAWPAVAQQGPSFDCAKASNAVEREICKRPELAKADREMAAAYAALSRRLEGAAKEHLEKDQVRWIAARNVGCVEDANGIEFCLKDHYAERTANLEAFADGPYPFIGEQALQKSGKLGKVVWSYDITYPRFDSVSADFSVVNARFADRARTAAAEATPKADAGIDREQHWTYQQSFGVIRPNARAVTIATSFYGYSGGAHGYGATDCMLVDLRSGKAVEPSGVLGGKWLDEMVRLVGVDLKTQFVEKPGFNEALKPANLRKRLSEPDHYCWRPGRLELIFNAYEVGPYAAGPYYVDIPMTTLRPLLRADGPLAR